jgi:hypothetical protein
MLENAGSAKLLVNMARDQIKNAICHARKILPELAVLAGETACSN